VPRAATTIVAMKNSKKTTGQKGSGDQALRAPRTSCAITLFCSLRMSCECLRRILLETLCFELAGALRFQMRPPGGTWKRFLALALLRKKWYHCHLRSCLKC